LAGVFAEVLAGRAMGCRLPSPHSGEELKQFITEERMRIQEKGIFGDLLAFLSHLPFFTKLGNMTDADKRMNPLYFWSDLVDTKIWINLKIWI